MKLWIVKLGGSIITKKKSGKPVIRRRVVSALCREIAQAYATDPTLHLLVLHGAGSLGHPLARKYKVANAPLDTQRLLGIGKIMTNMRRLTEMIATMLRQAGAPAIPLQTSSLVYGGDEGLHISGEMIVKKIIQARGIPVCGGDILFTSQGTSAIASADALAVLFAKHYQANHILFATDVAGVYQSFPPQAGEKPTASLSRQQLKQLLETTISQPETDLTGNMRGKLKALLLLEHTKVTVFKGVRSSMKNALAGKSVGTTITL